MAKAVASARVILVPIVVLLGLALLALAMTEADPASACSTAFANGVAPSNVPSPNKASLVPLCHTKGKSVFFYTVYDPSVLHALVSAERVRYSTLSKCDGSKFLP